MKLFVIGAGMQGRTIARNLVARPEKPEVTLLDINAPAQLPSGVQFRQVDVLNARQLAGAVSGADAAVLAVPSSIAHQALEHLLAAGIPVADVCFTPDPPLSLDALAKKTGACCIVDCGIAPGLSHILVGNAHAQMGGLDKVRILVGGMPQQPPPAFHHAVYFNPHDLLAEYIRPARARRGGTDYEPAPLDAPVERHADEELGALEAFLSDGLRSLLTSFPEVPDMAELTLRWPGHLDTMKSLRELGVLDAPDAVRCLGDVLSNRYGADKFPDVLLMLVEAVRGGNRQVWRLIDRRTDGESAMSRTTGFTTAAVAMVLARRQFAEPGVFAPEHLGTVGDITNIVVDDLRERGIAIRQLAAAAGR